MVVYKGNISVFLCLPEKGLHEERGLIEHYIWNFGPCCFRWIVKFLNCGPVAPLGVS